jgi:hypothetical protein
MAETLDWLPQFAIALFENRTKLFAEPKGSNLVTVDNLYCSSKQCGGVRRAMIDYEGSVPVEGLLDRLKENGLKPETLVDAITPALFSLSCMQCDAEYSAVIYRRDGTASLVILPSSGRGISSPHTPPGVAYYLDQAARSHSAGANTAAIAMFRTALEWILEGHGYKQRMLGPKLTALDIDVGNDNAPAWVAHLDSLVLQTLKNLGNTATHTNDGDISKQEAMDSELYRATEASLLEVIEYAYERPAKQKQRLRVMEAALAREQPK